jgi:hypothetical protein
MISPWTDFENPTSELVKHISVRLSTVIYDRSFQSEIWYFPFACDIIDYYNHHRISTMHVWNVFDMISVHHELMRLNSVYIYNYKCQVRVPLCAYFTSVVKSLTAPCWTRLSIYNALPFGSKQLIQTTGITQLIHRIMYHDSHFA